ncbi:unnamed protein product [Prorocentrum cordatum]|uniref:Uncharacterized protein n=1 Tax=Prorocentrum cordatum TaxID=2364126 RepID=A0ABN9QQR7_9DINO|nr:unnamed protein product [Polarella glacialis]
MRRMLARAAGEPRAVRSALCGLVCGLPPDEDLGRVRPGLWFGRGLGLPGPGSRARAPGQRLRRSQREVRCPGGAAPGRLQRHGHGHLLRGELEAAANSGACSPGPIRYLAAHASLPWFLSASDDCSIKLFEREGDWRCSQVFSAHSLPVTMCQWSLDSCVSFASSSMDSSVRLWNFGARELGFSSLSPDELVSTYELRGHTKGVTCVAYLHSAGSSRLASGSDDKTVRIWDVEGRRCLQLLRCHAGRVTSLACHLGRPLLVAAGEGHAASVWRPAESSVPDVLIFQRYRLDETVETELGCLRAVALRPDGGGAGGLAALGCDGGTVVCTVGIGGGSATPGGRRAGARRGATPAEPSNEEDVLRRRSLHLSIAPGAPRRETQVYPWLDGALSLLAACYRARTSAGRACSKAAARAARASREWLLGSAAGAALCLRRAAGAGALWRARERCGRLLRPR